MQRVAGEDEQCHIAKFRRLRNFVTCEFSHTTKIFTGNFCSPKIEHLHQHKTKNYEK